MKKSLLSMLCLLTLVGCNGGSTSSLQTSQNSTSSSVEVITSTSSSKTSNESVVSSTSSSSLKESSTSSESVVSSSSNKKVDATEIIEKLVYNPISVKGKYREYQMMGKKEYETVSYDITAVLTENYYYNELIEKGKEPSEQRIDKEVDGRAKVITLDPRTNAPMDNYLGDEVYGYYMFSDLFTNPFIEAIDSFSASKNKVTLVDFENMNPIFLTNIFTAGTGFMDATHFKSMTIDFDSEYNPTTIKIVFEKQLIGNVGQPNVCEYTGTFMEFDESIVSSLPTPREAQDGQDTIKHMFNELKKGNYTVNVAAEGSETVIPEPMNATSYVTQDGYYNVYTSGFNGKASDGKYMSNEGLVDFVVTEDNKIKETKKPYTIRTVDYYYGFAWNYVSESFDVNADGTFTLASELGFYDFVWSDLLPDINVVPVAYVDVGSLNIVVDSVNNKMTYTYTCLDGALSYSTEITNIGSTVFPLDRNDVIKFEGYSNWTDYCASSSWHDDLSTALDDVTGGSKDDVPYIECPYKYQRTYEGIFDYNWDVYPAEMIMIYVKRLTLVWELDTEDELTSQVNVIYDQLNNNSKYTYNEEENTYYYKNGDAEFSLTMRTESDYLSIDSVFNYAIIIVITNLVEYNPEA